MQLYLSKCLWYYSTTEDNTNEVFVIYKNVTISLQIISKQKNTKTNIIIQILFKLFKFLSIIIKVLGWNLQQGICDVNDRKLMEEKLACS